MQNLTIRRRKKESYIMFSFLIPALLLFSLTVVYPFLRGIGYSLTDWDGISPDYRFVGLKNYRKVFLDPSVFGPVKNSLLFTVLTVVFNNLFGLGIALLLKRDTRINKICRTGMFMPFVISMILAGFIWTYLFSDVFYTYWGVKSLLGNPRLVMIGVSLIGVWRNTGYVTLIYLAGLQQISDEYYEAAMIDGAGRIQQFRRITFPMLIPAFTINITLFLGWGLKVFDLVMAATKGGPGRASETFAVYVYNNTFPYNKAGYGQAAAIVMLIAIVLATNTVTAILRRKEDIL